MTVNLKYTEFNPEDFKEFTADDFDENLRGKQKEVEAQEERPEGEIKFNRIATPEQIAELGRRADPGVQAAERGEDFLGRVGGRLKGRLESIQEIVAAQEAGTQKGMSTFTQLVGQGVGAAADVLGESIVEVLDILSEGLIGRKGTDFVKGKIEKFQAGVLDIKDPQTGIKFGDAIEGMVIEFEKLSPENQRNLSAAGGLASFALEAAGLKPAKAAVEGVVGGVKKKLTTGISAVKEKVSGIKGIPGIVGETAEKKVAGFISEKPTAAASRKALEQGRIEPGKKVVSERLFGRTAAEIAPTKRIERAQVVIEDAVKGKRISTDDPQSFFTGVKEEGLTRAKNLEPRLAEMGLSDAEQIEFVQYITDIKNEYVGSDFAKKVLTAKERNALEAALDDMLKAENANDIWVARKNFDNHIPDRVKQASSTSDVSVLQSQAFWKEVRNGMNDGLEDIAAKFDVDVRSEFDDMASLFEARENMIAKAPDLLKAKPGIFGKEDMKTWLKRIGLTALAGKILLD